MKKAGFLTVALAGCLCFGLAACKPDDDGKQKGGDKTLTVDTDFEALVSDKVTEEEWRAVYTDANFLNVTYKERNKDGEEAYIYRASTETKCLYSVTNSTTVIYEDGLLSVYGYINGEWQIVASEELTLEEMYEFGYFSIEIVGFDFSQYFSLFQYDEEKGAYVYDGAGISVPRTPFEAMGSYNFEHVELKYFGGHLAYCRYQFGSNDLTGCYYNYGTTAVQVPEVAPDKTLTENTDFGALVSDKVTDAVW